MLAHEGDSNVKRSLARYCVRQADLHDLHDTKEPEWLTYCLGVLCPELNAMDRESLERHAEQRLGA